MIELIKWIINKKKIQEQIKVDNHKIDLQQIEINKLKHKIKELEEK